MKILLNLIPWRTCKNHPKHRYYDYIDKAERLKIEKIEMLDEFEEWNIIMGHYFGILAHSSKRVAEKDS